MSRSKRKTPIYGITTAESEKEEKAKWHRRLRHAESQRLSVRPFSEPHHIKQFYNPWNMAKDGKLYWKMGKDGETYWRDRPELLRK